MVTRRLLGIVAVLGLLVACGGEPEATGSAEASTAPDFTLELGEGGVFSLSEAESPVFMVFWAEW